MGDVWKWSLRAVSSGERPKPPRAEAGRVQTFQNSAIFCRVVTKV